MKKIKEFTKKNLKVIIGLIIGIMISGIVVYAETTLYNANEIKYDNDNVAIEKTSGGNAANVQEAIEALYEKASNASTDCAKGYVKQNETSTSYVCGPSATTTIASKSGIETTPFGKIYTGADPDNYVWFNDEQWRIVGIYTLHDTTTNTDTEHLKIVKATPSTTSQVYNSSTSSNAWNGSDIKTYLNGDYYSTLKQDAKDKIYTGGTWYAGAAAYNANASAAWTSTQATPWTDTTSGNVGLIASYEYLYAAENDGTCWTTSGWNYDGGCGAKDWLFSTLTNNGGSDGWLLSPRSDYSDRALLVLRYGGSVYYTLVTRSFAASPAVFLKSTITITGGNGQSGETNSYKLG